LVGVICINFTADWQRDPPAPAPSLETMRAFVADYESARGRSFTKAERRTIAASSVFAMAYRARGSHAIDAPLGSPGDVRPRLREDARVLLEHGI
jgi:hypothetical protein